jgi:hypothetical protein
VEIGEVIKAHGRLKITTIETFEFDDFDDPEAYTERLSKLDISSNEAVLHGLLPQYRNAKPEKWICPYEDAALRSMT